MLEWIEKAQASGQELGVSLPGVQLVHRSLGCEERCNRSVSVATSSVKHGDYFDIATRRIFLLSDVAELLANIGLRQLPRAWVPAQLEPE